MEPPVTLFGKTYNTIEEIEEANHAQKFIANLKCLLPPDKYAAYKAGFLQLRSRCYDPTIKLLAMGADVETVLQVMQKTKEMKAGDFAVAIGLAVYSFRHEASKKITADELRPLASPTKPTIKQRVSQLIKKLL